MALTDLIPWSRSRSTPTPFAGDDRDPFMSLQREMTRLIDDFSRGFGLPSLGEGNGASNGVGGWPHVEVTETDNEIKLCAELPGMEEKDVDVTLREGVLTIKGEKSRENQTPVYSERWHGQFQRSFQVGQGVDPDKVNAAFKNGLLTVTLGKRPEAQGQVKRIPVHAG